MWIVFEAVPTKLPHYVLPVYPAMAILVMLAAERAAVPFALSLPGVTLPVGQGRDHRRKALEALDRIHTATNDNEALVPVVEGAGGTMCDWNGEPLNADSPGHVIALGDPARLEDVIEGLACRH